MQTSLNLSGIMLTVNAYTSFSDTSVSQEDKKNWNCVQLFNNKPASDLLGFREFWHKEAIKNKSQAIGGKINSLHHKLLLNILLPCAISVEDVGNHGSPQFPVLCSS